MFFFYGLDKFIRGLDQVAADLSERFMASTLPEALAEAFAYVLPFLEVTLGSLLILGLFTRVALILAAVLMLGLTFCAVMEPNPATDAHNTNYALVIFVPLWLSDHNGFSVDRYRGAREKNKK